MNIPASLRLLDTDVLIDLQRQHPSALAWFSMTPSGLLALPGYVVMELYQSARNNVELRATDVQIAQLPVVWPTEIECHQAVANFRRLHLSHGLGLVDALIAATALSLGVPLCTFNVRHFRPISGLTIEQPYTR